MKKFDKDAYTYGVELEYADVYRFNKIPKGSFWNTKDFTLVNSSGIANDPLGKLWEFGGEINTKPTNSIKKQIEVISKINKMLKPKPFINYRSNLHIHIGIPNIKENIKALKKFLLYIDKYQKKAFSLVEPIPKPIISDFKNKEEHSGALKRYRRRCVSHQQILPEKAVRNMLKAKTVKEFHENHVPLLKSGQRGWFITPRSGINLRQLFETGTIEFRHFPGTLDLDEMYSCLLWCREFVYAGLVSKKTPLEIYKANKKRLIFPKFKRYIHNLEKLWHITNLNHNSRKEVKEVIENIKEKKKLLNIGKYQKRSLKLESGYFNREVCKPIFDVSSQKSNIIFPVTEAGFSKVLFVCLGNINRSPAGKLLWKTIVGTEAKSVGFINPGKPLSKKMRELLVSEGISEKQVNKHRSKVISKKHVNWADTIFCMSEKHRERLINMFPDCGDKISILSSFIDKKSIKDPGFSAGTKVYRETFEDIKNSIIEVKTQNFKFVNKFPFVILTKGRAGIAPFIKLLEKLELEFILTLEKNDVKHYTKCYNNIKEIIQLKHSNRGMGYSRYHTLLYMKKKYNSWYWSFDDDFTKFQRYNPPSKKFKEVSFPHFISKGEEVIKYYSNLMRLALVGYRQTPFGLTKDPIVINSRVIQLVAINAGILTGKEYDRKFISMNDEDFLIGLFKKGHNSLKINHFMYNCPYSAPDSQVGGHDYKKNPKIIMVRRLEKKYPGILKVLSDGGAMNNNPRYSIAWGKVKPKIPIKKIVDVEALHNDDINSDKPKVLFF